MYSPQEKQSIYDRIKLYIKNNELTVVVTAARIGISHKTLYSLLHGNSVSSVTLSKIRNFLEKRGL